MARRRTRVPPSTGRSSGVRIASSVIGRRFGRSCLGRDHRLANLVCQSLTLPAMAIAGDGAVCLPASSRLFMRQHLGASRNIRSIHGVLSRLGRGRDWRSRSQYRSSRYERVDRTTSKDESGQSGEGNSTTAPARLRPHGSCVMIKPRHRYRRRQLDSDNSQRQTAALAMRPDRQAAAWNATPRGPIDLMPS